VFCEKATNDAIAYSCKKIGHFNSTYFLHISSSFLFVFRVTIFELTAKKNATLQVTEPATLH